MASVYASTPETTNANRASRAVLGPCTDGLHDLLRHHVPPLTFPHVIKQNQLNLPRLTPVQRDLILPQHGHYKGNYTDMDISLLYILLRNISGISPHSNGWNRDPDPNDRSLSANIERIRLVRNHCVHSCDPFMSNTDFNSIWSTIRLTMVDLDVFLVNGSKYEKAVDFLRHESMDPENDLHYEEELRKQVEEDTKTREMVDNLESKLEKLTKSPIPQNVREQYDIDIEKWTEEDKLYYETHSFPSMMEKVRNQPCVTFVGVPGSGKSATAHHIALKLQEEGYEVVPVDEIREIKQYCDTKNPQVFVVDDVVGVFGLQKTKLDVLTDYEQRITQPCMVNSRTLMTCREVVFNETLPYKLFLTKEDTVIKLHGSDHALDDNDKTQIFQKYGLNVNLISPALLTSTSRMFPLLCKLFSKEPKFRVLGSKFFLNPVQCIIDELNFMQRHNKLNYATLVLCVLNENSLTKDNFKHKKFIDKKTNTLENCKLELNTDNFKFMDALSAMEGTYTKQCGARYTFIHDSMYEICAYQYGKQFPNQMLQYMSSSYIANYVKPQTSEPGIVNKVKEKQNDSQSIEGGESSVDSEGKDEHSDFSSIVRGESSDDSDGKDQESDYQNSEREESSDLCIKLSEDLYPQLAERLYRDIENMELYDVFRNQVLKHHQVCQAFIGVLKRKSYTELKDLFLSSQGAVDKIAIKRKCVLEESRKKREQGEWERQRVLIGRYRRDDTQETYRGHNVRVVSWVIYYGHYQIVEYIVQQTKQHNELCELFTITGNSLERSKSGLYTCNRQEREINRLVEECRLLVLSCYSDDIQTVRVLLPICKKAINGIDENSDWFQSTPLTATCEGGHVSIVEELVKAGADVNLQNRQGNTPLIISCKRGYVNVVGELVKVGVDVNLHNRLENTPLVAACEEGHQSIVEELVKAGADVNLRDANGNTQLIVACERGHVSIVEELVKVGADVNLKDNNMNTPLIVSCKRGHLSIVQELVKAGVDVNLKDNLNTPLIATCVIGHVDVVKELVKAGADVNLKDNNLNTPLIATCVIGHVDVVKELVKAGADVNLKVDNRETPLIVSCKKGHLSIVEELVKAGADVNLKDNNGNTPMVATSVIGHVNVVKKLVKAGADVNLQCRWGNTPLIAACEKGHVSVVKELVKAGADVNLKVDNKETPLIVSCKGGHLSMVGELVKAGADVNLKDDNRNIPLMAACKRGHAGIVEELVKAGADVNLKDDNRKTPLIVACEGGRVSIVKKLVKAGAVVNVKYDNRNTALVASCEGGHVSIVEELVKAGADVNLKDYSGNTPLIFACQGGHVGIVEELVKARADVNLKDDNRKTPLTVACEGGHVSIVEELVKAGADVNLKNYSGNTPLICACEGGHVSIVEELVKAGADANLKNYSGNTPLIFACVGGHVSIVKKLVKVGADVNVQNIRENKPLMTACKRGHAGIVEELVKAGADVNLKDDNRKTPLITAVRMFPLSTVKCLVEHGADWVPQVVDINVSAVYNALILREPDIVKYLIQEQNKITPGQFNGNVQLFNCLVDIRHAGVKTDSRDDVVVTDRSVWCMNPYRYLWRKMREGDCDVLRHLLCVGLDVNQSIQLYDEDNTSDVRPLLYTLIDGHVIYDSHLLEKLRILLGAGADVNIRVRYREYDTVVDREGVSVLEWTRRLVCKYSNSRFYIHSLVAYKSVMCEIKKHVRRHSV